MSVNVVYGPPGTGKTTLLLQRMSELKDHGVSPKAIGFFAFTRAAANEALSRLGIKRSSTIRTLHSLAYEVCGASREQVVDDVKLQEFAKLVGYPITGKTSIEPGPQTPGDIMLELHSLSRAWAVSLQEAWDKAHPDADPKVCRLFSDTYTNWKRAYGYLDFNDMLEQAVAAAPNLGLEHLYVDEGQDLSPLQWSLVRAVASHVPNVTLAGDDDQAIYTWAGADAHGMARWHDGASVEVLSQSHRVPGRMYALAMDMVHRIRTRVDKAYAPRPERGSLGRWASLGYIRAPKDEDTLVLYRNHSTRAEVENWLVQNRARYTITGPGLSSAFEDRYANALRTYMKIKDGQEVSMAQLGALKRVVVPRYQALLERPQDLTKIPWDVALTIPWRRAEYLRSVDLFKPANVRVSTIHAAKGAEADRVILMNEMGLRTCESVGDDEFRVWYVAITRARKTLDVIQGDNPIRM